MSDSAFPALGFDPAPGDTGNVDQLVDRLNRAAGALSGAHQLLTSVASGGSTWEGEAAKAFAGKVGELPGYLDDSAQAVKEASSQLGGWSLTLASYQETARRYEQQAAEARQKLEDAETRVDQATGAYNQAADNPAFGLQGRFYSDASELDAAQKQLDAAQKTVDEAAGRLDAAKGQLSEIQDELDAVIKQAKELLEHHQDDAGKVAKSLRKATKGAPSTSIWDKLGDAFQRIGHKIKDWATEHADLLKKIGDIASAASAVLGIAALATVWCPPLSGALAGAAAGASVVALGAHGLAKLGGADVKWSTLIGDGIGAFPFGKTVGIAGKGVTAAGRALKLGRVAGSGRILNATGGLLKSHILDGGIANKVISKTLAKTPISKLPSFAEHLGEDGVLKTESWWSRGVQLGYKVPLAGLSVPRAIRELNGDAA
ncbi:putative T7SS-secreted protein [Peterkaempfera sp. SMS 1(5)a]|uniref:putative T7SS-secreted protein n=1 Tax=Peterkaempfera podocarpi TaxID=3232308 RepID=UPI00366C07EE